MDGETEVAIELQTEIAKLIKKYKTHDHLTSFTSSLQEVVEEIDACLEDVEGVE